MEPDTKLFTIKIKDIKETQGKFPLRFSLKCGISNYWQGNKGSV